MIINDENLNNIQGGGWKMVAVGVGMILTIIVGIADGYMRPLKCN